jgi:hypothetical protein
MFTLDTKHKKPLIEADSLHGFILENSVSMTQDMQKYKGIITGALNEASGVFDDSVRLAMNEASKSGLISAIKTYQSIIGIVKNFKVLLSNEYESVIAMNKKVVEKYEPLIKQLDMRDITRISYEMPSYTLNSLKLGEMVARLLDALKTKLKVDLNGDYDNLEGIVTDYTKNSDKYVTEVKRSVLGVSTTLNVDGDFYSIAQNQLVTAKVLETKWFSTDIFEILKYPELNFYDIDEVIFLLENEVAKIQDTIQRLYTDIDNNGTNSTYYTSLNSNIAIIQSILFGLGMSYIEDILNYKLQLFTEKSVNYRRVVINSYNKMLKNPIGTINESYKPHADEAIGSLHLECVLHKK